MARFFPRFNLLLLVISAKLECSRICTMAFQGHRLCDGLGRPSYSKSCFAFLMSISLALLAQETSGKPAPPAAPQADLESDVTQGALRVVKKEGTIVECPLKHTDVRAEIAGFVGRVRVTQTFSNPSAERIEAVYVFPLPHEAAVDDMTMTLGERRVVGVIKKRIEARQIYEQALAAGQTAALLEQERPNIFTQSVGNIEPGQDVKIEISYVDVLRYDLGTYEFQFPMVVGPRYNPGSAISTPTDTAAKLQGKVSPPVANTTRVPDAERINPPVLRPGFRNGHDVSLSVSLDAGVPIQDLNVANHRASVSRDGEHKAEIVLAADDSVPNKDFVLRYRVAGKQPEMALLAHTGEYSGDARHAGNGYLMLMVQPREDERLKNMPPREIVFLVDVSGSMSGPPTDKVRETMQHMLRLCREQDTVQVITFASHAAQLFEKPVPATEKNIATALNFTAGLQGSGGTEMLKGVKLAIDAPIDAKRLRIVVMLTDGYIGNEAEIIEHVGKHCGDQVRFWCVGIGQAPNMFLVDGVAKQGGGMGKQLGINDDSATMALEIVQRIQRAQLSKVKIDWGDSRVSETFPARIPELWSGRPIIVFGRYANGGRVAKITVHGTIEGEPASWPLEVTLPAAEPQHDALAKVWSRKKIEDLMQQAYYQESPAIEEEVTALALDYRLMSRYTSFVAVDEKDAKQPTTPAAPPRRMLVPVPLPDRTRWEGFFGEDSDFDGERAVSLGRLSAAKPHNLALGDTPEGKSLRAKDSRRNLSYQSLARTRLAESARPRFAAAGKSAMGMGGGGFGGGMMRDRFGGGGMGMPGMGRMAGMGAMPAMPNPTAEYFFRADSAKAGDLAESKETVAAAWNQFQSQSKGQLDAARADLTLGRELQDKGKLQDAATAYIRACLLATSLGNTGASDEGIGELAIAALDAVRTSQLKEWNGELPALQKRLDLIVRDKSIDEALQMVSLAAEIKIELIPGSVDDSATLLGQPARVTYLDLRGATVAQACDWLLFPLRMTWQPAIRGKSLIAGTSRRLLGESPWIYDVSLIAWPTKEEIAAVKTEQRGETVVKDANEFVRIVQSLGRSAKLSHVSWFSPEQLLVVGTADQHSEVASLLSDLADPKAKVAKGSAAMHDKTGKRAEARMSDRKKYLQAKAFSEIAMVLQESGWRLLSTALLGRVNQESLTELKIAWSRPELAEMLANDEAALSLLRSAWVVNEASRLVPEDKELVELATRSRMQTQRLVAKAITALEKENVRALLPSAYAILVQRRDEKLVDEYVRALQPIVNSPEFGPQAKLILAILRPSSKTSESALVELAKTGVQGQDLIVLLAWACRQTGGEARSALRENSAELLSSQPLPGDVVVLVNRN